MKALALPLKGLLLVELDVFADERGFFVECYHEEKFRALGLPTRFTQENWSHSGPGVLRGLHYQFGPPQGKLIGVVRGRVWDVAVDIRPASATFGQSYGMELSGASGRLLWVPAGFAHGFCVLGDEPADVIYRADALYNADGEGGIAWDDPELAIAWPLPRPIVSPRDKVLPAFARYRADPVPWDRWLAPS